MSLLHHIAAAKRKHAGVPERAAGDVLLCTLQIRFFLECGDPADPPVRCRYHVPVFFTRIGGNDAHDTQTGPPGCRQFTQPAQRGKILPFHIRIAGTDYHRFILSDPLHIVEIHRRERDRRECIPAAWLHGDPHILPKLVMNDRNLRLGCGNGNTGVRIDLTDLAIHLLYHRFVGSVRPPEDFNKLLTPDIIGKRPEPLSGAPGEQNNIECHILPA